MKRILEKINDEKQNHKISEAALDIFWSGVIPIAYSIFAETEDIPRRYI